MRITKDNYFFCHSHGLWCCEIYKPKFLGITKDNSKPIERFKPELVSWAWSTSMTNAAILAKKRLEEEYKRRRKMKDDDWGFLDNSNPVKNLCGH